MRQAYGLKSKAKRKTRCTSTTQLKKIDKNERIDKEKSGYSVEIVESQKRMQKNVAENGFDPLPSGL